MSNLDAQTGLLSIDVPHEVMDHIKAYPLPEQVPDADMNQDELAAAFNVSATLSTNGSRPACRWPNRAGTVNPMCFGCRIAMPGKKRAKPMRRLNGPAT